MASGDFDQFKQFGEDWLQMLSRMAVLSGQFKVGEATPEAGRQLRGAVFKTMADQVDEFMRSEAFLNGMKEALESGLKFHKQYQNALAEFRHATQGIAATDVDAIMRMLHQLETRVLDRLEDLEARLEALKRHLEGGGKEPAVAGDRRSS